MTSTVSETASMFSTAVSTERFPKGERSAVVISAASIDGYVLTFEGQLCGRCGGTGRLAQFGRVCRGVCFACDGAGSMLTPAGRKARTKFTSLCDSTLPVLREEIQPGDRVWYRMRGLAAWAPVVSVKDDGRPGETIIGIGETKRVYAYPSTLCITIDHPTGRVGIQEATSQGYMIPRWDAERVAEIVNEVAAMPGACLGRIEEA